MNDGAIRLQYRGSYFNSR